MNKILGIVTIFVILFIGSFFLKNSIDIKSDQNKIMSESSSTQVLLDNNNIMPAGTYETYSTEKIMLASSTHQVVLFFRAGWCPTCRALDADIRANLSKISPGLTILDVDYDNSTVLKQKYGVTYQHTLVQVDAQGKLIKKWSGSPTLVALETQIK